LERDYWRNLTYVSPMYGADQLGTLFPKAFKHAWNLNGLDNLLSQTKVDLPGVTTPYIYVGMWKSTFAWHLEDMDLYSINYHHMGAPKHWYVVPPPHKDRFERVTRSTFPSDHKKCAEFMRHKSFVLSPKYLANQGIRVLKCVQRQGEFVITFPYSYHGGFNCGLNLAEAVNFATKAWIPIGKTAGFCRCISD
ncbi:JmjC domain, hydroxylase-domain-containing protein, partial [Hyaloraphidium curvatum]